MLDQLQFPIIVAAVLLIVGSFLLGTQWNVRKGDAFLKWLRGGMSLIGERTTMRWLGSSVLELKIAQAKDPFRTAETLVAFEPRDVVFIWAFEHLRGRRDTLIFRTQLRAAPLFELEAYDPRGWTRRNMARTQEGKTWSKLDMGTSALVAYGSDRAQTIIKELIDAAEQAGGKVLRLSVRRTVPNLEVHWVLPDSKGKPAQEFFTAVRQVAQQVLRQ